MLSTPITAKDISLYAWAVELHSREGMRVDDRWFVRLKEGLLAHPRTRGLFELNADLQRPSRTPVLRSDEFLTAHIILSCSRILQHRNDRELLELIRDSVRMMNHRFRTRSLWKVRSHLLGTIVDRDPYMTALIFRAQLEFSRISTECFRESLGGLSALIVPPSTTESA